MAEPQQPGGGARSWRARLRKLARDLGADDWEEPPDETPDDAAAAQPGAQASLDEVLRDAAEAREPRNHQGRTA